MKIHNLRIHCLIITCINHIRKIECTVHGITSLGTCKQEAHRPHCSPEQQ